MKSIRKPEVWQIITFSFLICYENMVNCNVEVFLVNILKFLRLVFRGV